MDGHGHEESFAFTKTRSEWRAERRAALADSADLDRIKNQVVYVSRALKGEDVPQFEIVLRSKALRREAMHHLVT